MEDESSFEVKTHDKTEHPSADQIEENKKKWGLEA